MTTTFLWAPEALLELLPGFEWHRLAEGRGNVPGRITEAWNAYREFYRLPELADGYSHQIGRQELAGYSIVIQTWCCDDAGGSVFMVHGYYDHVGLYGSIIQFCQQHRLNLVAFDLPGHGLSSGERAVIKDFSEYIVILDRVFELASSCLPGKWLGVGQSTGGGLLADYALRLGSERFPFSRLLLLAPLLRPRGWNNGRWVHMVASLFIRRLKRKFGQGGNNPEFSAFLVSDPLQPLYLSVSWVTALKRWMTDMEYRLPVDVPVTLVQGNADETVDWEYNTEFYAREFPQLIFTSVEGGHHHLVNETDGRWQVVERALDSCLQDL